MQRTQPLLDVTTAAGYLLKFMSKAFDRFSVNASSF